ncbi:MAG: hypothetical protein LOD87_07910 [Planifilum fulgidum]
MELCIRIGEWGWEPVQRTGMSVGAAILTAVLFGICITRRKWAMLVPGAAGMS